MRAIIPSIVLCLLPWLLIAQFNPFEKRRVMEIQFKGNVREVEIMQMFSVVKNGQEIYEGGKIKLKVWFDTAGYDYKRVMYANDGSVFYTVKTTTAKIDRSQLIDSTFDPNGDFQGREIISYNKSTKEFSKKYYVRDGTLTNMYIAKFDSKKREIEVRNGLPNKSSYVISQYSYGSDGQSQIQKEYDVYGKLNGITETTYIQDGKLGKTKYTATGDKLKYLVDYEYNQQGFLVREFKRKSDNSFNVTWDYSYSYDSVGNIIEKKALKNGIPAFLMKIKVAYY